MKRAFLAIAALAAAAAIAQPVAKLEVVAKAKPPSQHERIEAKLDQVLELLRSPAKPPAPPTIPKPADPAPPAPPADNPFTAWCAQGLNLVDIASWKLHRGLTAAEVELAYASGCPRPGAAPAGAPGEPGGVNPAGFDLGEGGGTVLMHTYAAGQARTFTFTVRPGGRPSLTFFGVSGSYFGEVTDTGPGFSNRKTRPGGSLNTHRAIDEGDGLRPGRYAYTVAPDTAGRFGIQFRQ